ncbi:DUF4238 domain-containing protein [Photobacterium damselae]|uniref:DUF4238 domain-containing protein n=2 Tax=Photobacterium damselae TaxID=38293 RepID=D0YVS5_PHODD|nr:DUF4238 domain-containing protein [Photobacterium damselae]EEZ40958.1 hypothetical protein VDA_001990 [Photobacterium damselae subsp. damselae CIP 102761]PSW86855.1 DUF4238 domain-containing protein [Photobacterium damselae]SPY28363.1 Uncharacterised protein [Photobacterium damselae]
MPEASKKHLEAKKNHHHVWANYMRRWSPDNKQVYYTTKKNNDIRLDSVKSIAVERDFYRVKPLKPEHVQVIRIWSLKSPKDLHELHMSYLNDYLKMQYMESLYVQSGKKDETVDKLIEAWKSNGIENYHTAHENEVQEILEALANRDLSILDKDDNMIKFMQFFGHQIARTKNFKDTISNAADNHIKTLTLECWWFIGYMFGMSIGRSLYLDRKDDTHCLLINDTDIPFITSDQPIVNVHPALTAEVKPPEDHECDFYYPISPNVAYMINKSSRFPCGMVQVSVDVVEEMNINIAKRANFHIIGNSKESLKPYKKFVGLNFNAVKAVHRTSDLRE